MASNPVIKLKRGAYSNLTNYASIDGQIYFASNGEGTLQSAFTELQTENKGTNFNTLVFDIQEGNSVIRRDLDAFRAIYAINAGTAKVAEKAQGFATSAGSASTPIYFNDQGAAQNVTSIPASMISGVIDISHIPHSAQERVVVVNDETGTTIASLGENTTPSVQLGDVVRNTADGQMYYVVQSADQDHTPAGDIRGTHFNFAKFSAGVASTASYANTAGALATARTIALTGAATGSGSFDGSNDCTISITNLRLSKVQQSDSAVTITGILPVANGGTGKASWTQGGLVACSASSTTTLTQLGNGTSGQILVSGGDNALPVWTNAQNITVGNASSLSSTINVNGTAFNAGTTSNTAHWGVGRTVYISDSATTPHTTETNKRTLMGEKDSGDYVLYLPTTIKATIDGKASSAGVADTLLNKLDINIVDVNNISTNVCEYGKTATANTPSVADISANSLFPLFTATLNSAITAGTWTPISTPTGMLSGTYVVQIACANTQFNAEYFSGVMSFSSETCAASQNDSDEVFLHCNGKGISGHHIYLRTRRVGGSSVVIEMTSDITTSAGSGTTPAFTLKFRKMM